MVRTFLKVYMEIGSYFLFLQEEIKDIIMLYWTVSEVCLTLTAATNSGFCTTQ
jgi:hypothetical protein